jgi:hypothetical protein
MCRSRCLEKHRVGNDQATPAFESCLVRECAASCKLVCGGAGELATPDGAEACQSCFVGQGCSTVEACMSDPACAKEVFCVIETLTPTELSRCSLEVDAGRDSGLSASALMIVSETCAAACDDYTNYSCVGHVTWPAAASGDLTILLTLLDGPTLTPSGAGITAKVCHSSDLECAHPTAKGITLADGTVKLVQHREAGPVVTEGYIDLSGGSIVPTIFFWSYPLSQSRASLNVLTATQVETNTIVQSLEVSQEASNGYVLVVGRDCLQAPAAELTYAVTPVGSSKVFYFNGLSFSPGLSATTT